MSVQVATNFHQGLGRQPLVTLPQGNTVSQRQFDQSLPAVMVKPGICRTGHRLGLHRGVNRNPFSLLRLPWQFISLIDDLAG